jgi:hypothetical protein
VRWCGWFTDGAEAVPCGLGIVAVERARDRRNLSPRERFWNERVLFFSDARLASGDAVF